MKKDILDKSILYDDLIPNYFLYYMFSGTDDHKVSPSVRSFQFIQEKRERERTI